MSGETVELGARLIALVACLFTAAYVVEPAPEWPAFDLASELSAPVSYAGSTVELWMTAGVMVLVALIRRRPWRMADTVRFPFDDPCPTGLPQNGAVQR